MPYTSNNFKQDLFLGLSPKTRAKSGLDSINETSDKDDLFLINSSLICDGLNL
jgi:hypothetical protein